MVVTALLAVYATKASAGRTKQTAHHACSSTTTIACATTTSRKSMEDTGDAKLKSYHSTSHTYTYKIIKNP
jgi:hypothetical protein